MAEAKPSSSAVKVDISGTRFPLIRKVVEQEMNMVVTETESDDCDLYWFDVSVSLERYLQLKPHQMINHFYGMGEISRKDCLARNIQKMKQIHEAEYNILPHTWVLPLEYLSFVAYMQESRLKINRHRIHQTYIIKPHNSSMGNGISLARTIADIPLEEQVVVQEYIENPLLLDRYKFDLRVYVLVTDCNPLRIFVYKDGLVRLSTECYTRPNESNIRNTFMHLTNYSVNKHSESFDHDKDFDKGSKRSLKYLNGWLSYRNIDPAEIWSKIHDLIIKTLIVAQPYLRHSYVACRPSTTAIDKCRSFEILGFDIILDNWLKPWLLEVNRSPSFGADAHIDMKIKKGVLTDALRLVDVRHHEKPRQPSIPKSYNKLVMSRSFRNFGRGPLDFSGEMEDARLLNEKRIEEVKFRLSVVRKEKEMEKFEDENKGDYTRIYPCPDSTRQRMYKKFLADSARLCYSIRPEPSYHEVHGLQRMKERELVDLLEELEGDKMAYPNNVKRKSSVMEREKSPVEAEQQAMAARVYEEEQTQRTMLSLNAMEPTYPGKKDDEVKGIVKEVWLHWEKASPKVELFWLTVLNNGRRKELLTPLRSTVKGILQTHWRTGVIENSRIYKIVLKLLNFLLSNHGQGLWCTYPVGGAKSDNWEQQFKKNTDVLSITEMCCCRKMVELVQGTVIAASEYYERQINRPAHLPRPRGSVDPTQPTRRQQLLLHTRRRAAPINCSYPRHQMMHTQRSLSTVSSGLGH